MLVDLRCKKARSRAWRQKGFQSSNLESSDTPHGLASKQARPRATGLVRYDRVGPEGIGRLQGSIPVTTIVHTHTSEPPHAERLVGFFPLPGLFNMGSTRRSSTDFPSDFELDVDKSLMEYEQCAVQCYE